MGGTRDETEHHYPGEPRRDRDPDIEPPRSAQRRLTRHDRGTDRLLLGAARSADHARRNFARQRTRILRWSRTRIGRVCRAWQGTTTTPAQDAAELFRRHSFDALMPATDHRACPWRRLPCRFFLAVRLR